MAKIFWDAGATLEKATVKQHKPSEYVNTGTEVIWRGTLGGVVRKWDAKPDSQKPLYSALVAPEAGVGKTSSTITILKRWPDILTFQRPDPGQVVRVTAKKILQCGRDDRQPAARHLVGGTCTSGCPP